MEGIRSVGLGAFLLANLVVGSRLLWQARRSRELPELCIGLAFLLAGCLGYVLNFLSFHLAAALGCWAIPLAALGQANLNFGTAALWIFTWRVFRPAQSWARILVAAALAATLISYVGLGVATGFTARAYQAGWFWLGFCVRWLSFLWTSAESLLYHRRMKRRLALGLAEPLVTNRLLLWGLASAAIALSFAVNLVNLLVGGAPFGPVPTLFMSGFGLTTAVLIWLAFFPPARYRERIQRSRVEA